MIRPAIPTAPTPPRLGALFDEAFDAVYAQGLADGQGRVDRSAALAESGRARKAVFQRLWDVAPEEYVPRYEVQP